MVYLVLQGHDRKRSRRNKRKSHWTPYNGKQEEASDHNWFEFRCHFHKKKGHKQKDFIKYKAWFQKNGNFLSFVYNETNLVDVSSNTWWLDLGVTIHVSNNIQRFLTTCQPMTTESTIITGDGMGVKVEAVGTYRLILNSKNLLNLSNTFYATSFSRNLLSLPCLDLEGYVFHFENNSFTFSKMVISLRMEFCVTSCTK